MENYAKQQTIRNIFLDADLLLGLLLDPEHGDDKFLRNVMRSACCLLHADLLLDLLFDPEYGDIFLRNFS
jgi:hypothetical protein